MREGWPCSKGCSKCVANGRPLPCCSVRYRMGGKEGLPSRTIPRNGQARTGGYGEGFSGRNQGFSLTLFLLGEPYLGLSPPNPLRGDPSLTLPDGGGNAFSLWLGFAIDEIGLAIAKSGLVVAKLGFAIAKLGLAVAKLGFAIDGLGLAIGKLGLAVGKLGFAIGKLGFAIA